MVAHIKTVAFLGVDAVAVGVQMHLAPCYKAFTVFGLPDKSVAESRERVRARGQSLLVFSRSIYRILRDCPHAGRSRP